MCITIYRKLSREKCVYWYTTLVRCKICIKVCKKLSRDKCVYWYTKNCQVTNVPMRISIHKNCQVIYAYINIQQVCQRKIFQEK